MSELIRTDAVLSMLEPKDVKAVQESEQTLLEAIVRHVPSARKQLEEWLIRPGCGGCRQGLALVLADHPEGLKTFLDEVDPERKRYDFVVRALGNHEARISGPNPTVLHGKVYDVEDTPEAWEVFTKGLRAKAGLVGSFSVRPLPDNKIRVYFV